MIKPTVGRIVWYYAGTQPRQALAAIVAYVHNDRLVNLGVFDTNGALSRQGSVRLVQEGEEYPNGPFCEWMPYQKGQAAKTEELQKKVAAA